MLAEPSGAQGRETAGDAAEAVGSMPGHTKQEQGVNPKSTASSRQEQHQQQWCKGRRWKWLGWVGRGWIVWGMWPVSCLRRT